MLPILSHIIKDGKILTTLKIKSHIRIIIIFTILYWIAGKIEKLCNLKILDNDGRETDEYIIPITLFDAFYFSLVTQTTVGYGNIFPESRLTQIINAFQLISIFGVYLI